jgi:predicted nucleic acid-binding protein
MKVVLDLKIVMDTNVFVSGVFFSGPPYEIRKTSKVFLNAVFEPLKT